MTTPKTPATPQAVPTTATKPKLRRRARTPKRPKALTLGGMIPRRKPKSLFTGAAGPPRAPSGPATSPSPASPPPAGSVPIPGPLIAQMTQMSPHMDFAPLRPVFARWRDDPVLFVQQALHVKRIEPWQMAALRDLVRSNRVAVRSGHAYLGTYPKGRYTDLARTNVNRLAAAKKAQQQANLGKGCIE